MSDKRFVMVRFAAVLLLLLPLAAAASESAQVKDVPNGKSLVLAGGDTVRLAGIEAPNVAEPATPVRPARPGEPLGDEARAALAALADGKTVRLELNPAGRDRHGRLLGQVYRSDGVWLQGELLRAGWAMVYAFADEPPALVARMLAAEREARQAKRGIWANPYYRIVTPAEAGEFVNRYKLACGKVVSVNTSRAGHVYLNFFDRWQGRFAVFISRKFAPSFAAMDPKALAGKTICVRGWIHYFHAPEMDVTTPEQIEVEAEVQP